MWQNICRQMSMEHELQCWMNSVTESFCGITDQLRIFGEWDAVMPESWQNMESTLWETSPDAPLGKKQIFITKICCTGFLESMQNF